ncbi:MAG: hypothetical protein H7Z73_06300 [Candidatus Saccharibacteria bacterium]|nr:hypothetical protein [Moraxellaceae bacterium]
MSKILIIGNGFDLNLGLKTSYSDFIKSEQFQNLVKSNNYLAGHLQNIHSDKNWVDIEHELKNYGNVTNNQSQLNLKIGKQALMPNERPIKCKADFVELKNALMKHLESEIKNSQELNNKINQASKVLRCGYLKNFNAARFNMLEPYFNEILTFNYTNFFDQFFHAQEKKNLKIHHIHGSIDNRDIVFGVEDGTTSSNYSFLNKSDHAAFGKTKNVSATLIHASEAHFFGCSLGDTDNAHFKRAFKIISTNELKHSRIKIYFYVYGKQGYRDIFNRIMALTENHVSEFKLINEVTFYDLQEDKEIDQAWLNE